MNSYPAWRLSPKWAKVLEEQIKEKQDLTVSRSVCFDLWNWWRWASTAELVNHVAFAAITIRNQVSSNPGSVRVHSCLRDCACRQRGMTAMSPPAGQTDGKGVFTEAPELSCASLWCFLGIWRKF